MKPDPQERMYLSNLQTGLARDQQRLAVGADDRFAVDEDHCRFDSGLDADFCGVLRSKRLVQDVWMAVGDRHGHGLGVRVQEVASLDAVLLLTASAIQDDGGLDLSVFAAQNCRHDRGRILTTDDHWRTEVRGEFCNQALAARLALLDQVHALFGERMCPLLVELCRSSVRHQDETAFGVGGDDEAQILVHELFSPECNL